MPTEMKSGVFRREFRYCSDLQANEWLQSLITKTVELVLDEFGEQRVQAILLLGSLARGEGSVCRQGGRFVLLGDLEFFVVLYKPFKMGEARRACRALCHRGTWRDGSLTDGVSIDLTPTSIDSLARTKSTTIFAYDLCANKRLCWGDASVLDALPAPNRHMIAREDAVRLVANRMIEFGGNGGDRDPLADGYWKAKVLLDLAGSLLAFEGRYESSYEARVKIVARCKEKAATFAGISCPINFNNCLEWAARCKIDPTPDLLSEGAIVIKNNEILSLTRKVWEWEIREWLGSIPSDSTLDLVERYKKHDSYYTRMRGWVKYTLHPLRPPGTLSVSRMLWQILLASPQTLCYASLILYIAGTLDRRSDWNRKALEWMPFKLDVGHEPIQTMQSTWRWLLK